VAKRRRSKRALSKAQPTAAEQLAGHEAVLRAVEAREAEARRVCAGTASELSRIDQAMSAVERQIASAERGIEVPRRGILAWFGARAKAWRRWRRRRHAARVARTLERGTRDDHTSSAMLAVLTERVARLGRSESVPEELAEAIEHTVRILADYNAHKADLEHRLEHERGKVEYWIGMTAKATNAGAADLASQAQERVTDHERSARDYEDTIDICNAGRRRLHDALEQLEALAQRSAQPAARRP
jgi:septal ring factor EnvC (AmiA/AmiB activator)